MDVYRADPIPVVYTQLGFVRASKRILADCLDDVPLLKQIQAIVTGTVPISNLQEFHEIIVKGEFPDDILRRCGDSGDPIEWKCYFWKLWDAESLVTGGKPAEAIDPQDGGIDDAVLSTLSHPTSCLPWLRKTERALDVPGRRGFRLTDELAAQLEQIERPLIARCELKTIKRLRPALRPSRANRSRTKSVSPSLRDEILRRDGYMCVFCGRKAPAVTIEVNHIIPRSLIDKLNLDRALHTAHENLCTTCFDCNRAKRDNLAKEDIQHYLGEFANPEHANHGILRYLCHIAQIQAE